MRILMISILFMLFLCSLTAQKKHDYVWVAGINSDFRLDFNGPQVEIDYITNLFSISSTNATYSDKDGHLLFYSNGCAISDGNNELIENGDSINYHPDLYYDYCPFGGDGSQDILLLPYPGHVDEYILIHKPRNALNIAVSYPSLMYTHIVRNSTFPNGIAVEKNTVFHTEDLLSSYLTAIQHENQEDWWIIQPIHSTNKYVIFLLTEEGVSLVNAQEIGNVYFYDASASGQAKFSPDGTQYATYNYGDELQLFDFDRATGLLSNHQHIEVDTSTIQIFSGLSWSSNSRYLYASTTYRLYQVDTYEENLADSVEWIATWSGLSEPFPNIYYLSKLGPDCRIYIRSASSSKSYHVIHYPNRKGEECGFVEGGLPFSESNGFANFPNDPHWRVDEVEKCDSSIVTMFGKAVYYQENLVLYPNPARDFIYAELPMFYKAGMFYLFDLQGKLHREWHEMSIQEQKVQVDVSDLTSGNYILEFLPDNNPERKVYNRQFVRE